MTALAMNYVVNPLGSFWRGIEHFVTVVGCSRAAAELARQGRHDLAKKLMLQKEELTNK